MIPDRLKDGALGRVAETGQIVTQVSATEPAISNLPVALIAVPVVGGGRVEAVLVLVRDAAQPFDNDDRESLGAMAPVVAAAMQAADQAEVMAEAGAIDPLTGVANRRTLDKELDEQLTNAGDEPTSLVMVDIDHFKRVNDNFGHPAGDEVLKGIAAVLRDTVRPDDRVYRYGGEEFCVILPRTTPDEAAMVAERLREAVRGASFDIGDDEPYRASASFGVATTSSSTPGELVAQADKALYDAKRDGRDRVVVASPA